MATEVKAPPIESKVREFRIIDHVYRSDVFFAFGTLEALRKHTNKLKLEDEERDYVGRHINRGMLHVVCLVNDGKAPTVFEEGVLGHEIFHLVSSIMQNAGNVLSDDSEEAYAYLFQYFMCEALVKLYANTK